MSGVHVRDVPEEVFDALRRRAAAENLTHQAVLLRVLTDWATTATPREAAVQARELALRSRVTADDIAGPAV